MAARRTFGRFLSLAILVAAEAAAVGLLTVSFAPVANAQFFFDDRYPFLERRRYRTPRYEPAPQQRQQQQEEERPPDYSRAPAPEERKADAPPVTTKILMFGDSLADWLAYGLEEALAETPEIGIIRKHKAYSGLIKYDDKPDSPSWPQVAREAIAAEKPNAIIMLLGIADRKTIREEPKEQKEDEAKKQDEAKPGEQDSEQPQIAAPERDRDERKSAGGSYEYRSEKWEEAYSRKIDDMIAVLKTGNVPVLWVGLPSIRGKRSTSDALYLNEFYRARAEAAGIMYVDVWDGFVDENGRYTTSGPDLEGQIRRLRTGDGVHFTKAGARKLAHYVERELRRVLANPVPVALTMPDQTVQQPAAPAKPLKPTERPLAGPVFLLTKNTEEADELLGGAAAGRPAGDPVATGVLVRGEAIVASAGRADDHSWPPRIPNTEFAEPLPPSGAPILMVKPPPPPKPPVQTAQQPRPPRVAGQQVLQGQVRPQQPPPAYRDLRAPPAYYGPLRGFFGLFR